MSDSDAPSFISSKNLLMGSLAALAILGVSTATYSALHKNSLRRKPKEIFNSRAAKKNKCSPEEDVAPFLRKQPRRVTLYFNENDELVDEATALSDPNSYYHKYHSV